MTIATLIVDVAANTAKLQTDVQKIHGQLDNVGAMASKVGTVLAGAFTVTAITNAASQVLNYAGKISDLSAQTGLTTDTIQEMQHAATLTGASLENFTNAAFKLGTTIAGGDDSVHAALNKLGLSYEEIRRMSPDQQFKVIASALGDLENVQDRNRIAVDLFGKAAKDILPAISAGYDELASAAFKASEDQIEALDKAGEALDGFMLQVKGAAVMFAGMVVLGVQGWNELEAASRKATATTWDYRTAIDALDGNTSTAVVDLDKLKNTLKSIPPQIATMTSSTEGLARAERYFTAATKARAEETRRAAKVSADAAVAAKAADADRMKALQAASALESKIADENAAFRAKAIAGVESEAKAWRDYYNEKGLQQMEATAREMEAAKVHDAEVLRQRILFANLDTEAKKRQQAAGDSLREMAEGFVRLGQVAGGAFGDIMQGVGTIVVSLDNVQRGAGVASGMFKSGATASQRFGSALASAGAVAQGVSAILKATAEETDGLTNALNGAVAGAQAGSAFGGWGAAIGAVMGALQGWGQASMNANKATLAWHQTFTKTVNTFKEAHSAIADLDKAAAALGISFDWTTRTEANLEKLVKQFAEFDRKLKDTNKTFGDLLGKANDIGIALPAALKASIQQMIDLGVITGETAALFGTMADQTGVDFKKMQEAAQRYGIDLGSLGKTFQQQRLHEMASQIINDFDLLIKGGADVGGVLFGMKDEISKLVVESIQFGTKIPENMKPWIEELLKAGLLTDANGVKITDISNIQFGEKVATEYEKIVASISTLVATMQGFIDSIMNMSGAVDKATAPRTIHIGFAVDEIPDIPNSDNFPGFANGSQGVRDFGSKGTLAVLHGRERVQTESQMKQERQALASSGGGDSALAAEMKRLIRDLPRAMKVAVSDAMVLQGAR